MYILYVYSIWYMYIVYSIYIWYMYMVYDICIYYMYMVYSICMWYMVWLYDGMVWLYDCYVICYCCLVVGGRGAKKYYNELFKSIAFFKPVSLSIWLFDQVKLVDYFLFIFWRNQKVTFHIFISFQKMTKNKNFPLLKKKLWLRI